MLMRFDTHDGHSYINVTSIDAVVASGNDSSVVFHGRSIEVKGGVDDVASAIFLFVRDHSKPVKPKVPSPGPA